MSALDPKQQAAFDQASKQLSDNIPLLLNGLFVGFKEVGFSENQAFRLCEVYLESLIATLRPN